MTSAEAGASSAMVKVVVGKEGQGILLKIEKVKGQRQGNR